MKAWSNNKLRKYYEANSLCHKETHELIGIRLECQQRIPYESYSYQTGVQKGLENKRSYERKYEEKLML